MTTQAIETNGKGGFRVLGRGAWLSEGTMDSRLPNGGYVLYQGGQIIGAWVQHTTGHCVFDA